MEPTSFRELMLLLTTSGTAVGALSAFLTALLWSFLAEYWPGSGYRPSENRKRAVSVVLPFVLVLGCYGVLVLQGATHFDEETLWTVIGVAVFAVTGKQIAFTGYRALRPQATPQS
jgi:hypothetical protein